MSPFVVPNLGISDRPASARQVAIALVKADQFVITSYVARQLSYAVRWYTYYAGWKIEASHQILVDTNELPKTSTVGPTYPPLLTRSTHASSFTSYASPNSTAPLVNLKDGTLIGVHNLAYDQDFFLGVPYASPPVGDLRFRRPIPPRPWNGSRVADSYGPWCMGNSIDLAGFSQKLTGNMSEDCLHLNLIRPARTPPSAKLPVLVWIHGGGFDDGSANDGRSNGTFLVQSSVAMGSPVIFVSLNYRLGVFGMLAGSAIEREGATNLFLHDQRQALTWVQENIGAFGGDASRVTIMGESAGAASVGLHLVAYGGRGDGLFSAAIAQSGGPFTTAPGYRNTTQREDDFRMVLNVTGCAETTDSLTCLRHVAAESIRTAALHVPRSFTIDGDILPEDNVRLLRDGRFVRVPLLIGSTRNEGTSFVQQLMSAPFVTDEDFLAFVLTAWGSPTLPLSVLQAWTRWYQDDIDEPSAAGLGTVDSHPGQEFGPGYGRATLWMGDFMFTAGRRAASQAWAKWGVPSYSYFFDAVPANANPETLGAAHFLEIPYTFGNLEGVGWESNPFPSESRLKAKHRKLAEVMSRMWLSFVV
ncbi:Lipase [Paramyrothecium foliicola]|nr:Lipase [Paramyrothecium foliicola]